jgi:DNA-binding GntR family transcriptional regulator
MPMTPIDPMGREFAYVQLADDIAWRITIGEFTCRLPAERALAEEYDVAYATMRQAMGVLRERDLIRTRVGRGTFVAAAMS